MANHKVAADRPWTAKQHSRHRCALGGHPVLRRRRHRTALLYAGLQDFLGRPFQHGDTAQARRAAASHRSLAREDSWAGRRMSASGGASAFSISAAPLPGGRGHVESIWHFLERSTEPVAIETRRRRDEWLSWMPPDARAALITRLKDRHDDLVRAALAETFVLLVIRRCRHDYSFAGRRCLVSRDGLGLVGGELR
jgi:hypothetical protein